MKEHNGKRTADHWWQLQMLICDGGFVRREAYRKPVWVLVIILWPSHCEIIGRFSLLPHYCVWPSFVCCAQRWCWLHLPTAVLLIWNEPLVAVHPSLPPNQNTFRKNTRCFSNWLCNYTNSQQMRWKLCRLFSARNPPRWRPDAIDVMNSQRLSLTRSFAGLSDVRRTRVS